ncbi:MAG: efflux RND transporter periplasmic adaptor subunit [Betaproteobacteria bacterium]|nr:efflux RND transporter periplasmic adaptor subunit [Betaproteobacteria bacterium]
MLPRSPLFASALALIVAACGDNAVPPPAAPAVLVRIALPATASGTSYAGEVRARHEADLGFRVGGKIAARLVDAGATVRAGQPLARLDPADLELASTAAATQVAAAESELRTASAERDRYADLLRQRFVSQAAFDAKENTYRGARSRLDQARAQGRISANQAAYGTLVADHDGVIAAVLAETGQIVAAGQAVVRLARPDELEVLIALPEARIAEARAAREADISLWARPDLPLHGTLREVAAAADPATRTYAARIRIANPPPGIELGMTARVSFAGHGAAGVLVPLGAVEDSGSGPRIWVVADGRAQPRPVRVARYLEDGALIADGIVPGEPVIVSGQRRLIAGQAVQARAATAPADQR